VGENLKLKGKIWCLRTQKAYTLVKANRSQEKKVAGGLSGKNNKFGKKVETMSLKRRFGNLIRGWKVNLEIYLFSMW
jgi:hypothetical protein